jgi:hypothetical protein
MKNFNYLTKITNSPNPPVLSEQSYSVPAFLTISINNRTICFFTYDFQYKLS